MVQWCAQQRVRIQVITDKLIRLFLMVDSCRHSLQSAPPIPQAEILVGNAGSTVSRAVSKPSLQASPSNGEVSSLASRAVEAPSIIRIIVVTLLPRDALFLYAVVAST